MSSDVQAKCTNSSRLPALHGDAVELLLHEVLDRLDVVIGLRLDRLDARRVVDAELVDDLVQHVLDRRLERRELGDARLVRELLQPAHFDPRALADQPVFGKVLAQRRRFARVAAVERREREKRWCVQVPPKPIQAFRSAHHTPRVRAVAGSISSRSRHGGRFSRRARQHGRAASARAMRCGARRRSARSRISRSAACAMPRGVHPRARR